MELAPVLLAASPGELEALGWAFADRERLLASGKQAQDKGSRNARPHDVRATPAGARRRTPPALRPTGPAQGRDQCRDAEPHRTGAGRRPRSSRTERTGKKAPASPQIGTKTITFPSYVCYEVVARIRIAPPTSFPLSRRVQLDCNGSRNPSCPPISRWGESCCECRGRGAPISGRPAVDRSGVLSMRLYSLYSAVSGDNLRRWTTVWTRAICHTGVCGMPVVKRLIPAQGSPITRNMTVRLSLFRCLRTMQNITSFAVIGMVAMAC